MMANSKGPPSDFHKTYEKDLVTAYDALALIASDEGCLDEDAFAAVSRVCSSCGSLATTRCGGCQNAPSTTSAECLINGAWYCGKACQTNHWRKHKQVCKRLQQRIQIHHAAQLVKEIWLVFRRWTWHEDVRTVKRYGSDIKLHIGNMEKHFRKRHLYPFKCTPGLGLDIVDACLIYNMCQDALVWLRPIMEALLQGQGMQIEEFQTSTKNQRLRMSLVDPAGNEQSTNEGHHQFWIIKTKLGEEWVVDPTASQYGWEVMLEASAWQAGRARTGIQQVPSYAEYAEWWLKVMTEHDLFDVYLFVEFSAIGNLTFKECLPHIIKDTKNGLPELSKFFLGNSQEIYRARSAKVCGLLEDLIPPNIETYYATEIEKMRKTWLMNYLEHIGKGGKSEAEACEFEEKCINAALEMLTPPQ